MVHGFSDQFLAARVRFLAAYERVYSIHPPLTAKQRKIRVPLSILSTFDTLQKQHHNEQDWTIRNPDAEGGEETLHHSFAVALLNKENWQNWTVTRKHNWWIPLASAAPELRYTHDMMVSHGITLFSATQQYGTGAIEVNEATQHIENTNNLCIAHIEKYWKLAQKAKIECKVDKSDRAELVPRLTERQLQLEYVQENMAICKQVAEDLTKARTSVSDRVTRGARA